MPFPSDENNIIQNELLSALMFLDRNAVLHMVHSATRFFSASYLGARGESCYQSADDFGKLF